MFVSLQAMSCAAEIDALKSEYDIDVVQPEGLDMYDDLDGVAALISGLDLVISVATAVAKIAAAIGTPTWQLTWSESSWNNSVFWPRGPAVRRIERPHTASWSSVLDEVARSLAAFLADRARSSDFVSIDGPRATR